MQSNTSTRELVHRGLDRALALQIGKLFEVLMSDTSKEGQERFWKGLTKAADMHRVLGDRVSAK